MSCRARISTLKRGPYGTERMYSVFLLLSSYNPAHLLTPLSRSNSIWSHITQCHLGTKPVRRIRRERNRRICRTCTKREKKKTQNPFTNRLIITTYCVARPDDLYSPIHPALPAHIARVICCDLRPCTKQDKMWQMSGETQKRRLNSISATPSPAGEGRDGSPPTIMSDG